MAQSRSVSRTGAFFAVHEDGSRLTRAELRAARRQAEQDARRRQAEAVPLDGGIVFGFPLVLSTGDIAGEPLGPERKEVLTRLYGAAAPGRQIAEALTDHAAEDSAPVAQLDGGDPACGTAISPMSGALSWLCWELQAGGSRRGPPGGPAPVGRRATAPWSVHQLGRDGAVKVRRLCLPPAGPGLSCAPPCPEWEHCGRRTVPWGGGQRYLRTVPATFSMTPTAGHGEEPRRSSPGPASA
jgi:hypothetical protein